MCVIENCREFLDDDDNDDDHDDDVMLEVLPVF